MAEGQRMTAAQVVDKLMTSEHADVLRESVAWLVAELIEAEVTEQIGAAHGELAPERRTTQRTATGRASGTPASGRFGHPQAASGIVYAVRRSSSRAGAPSRRSSRSSRRPTSTASRPERSTGSSSSSACTA